MPVITAYDTIADWYDETLRGGALLHTAIFPELFDVIGETAGLYLCDLACGQGIVTRELARRACRWDRPF